MDQLTRRNEGPDLTEVGDAAAAIMTLAGIHGFTADAEPIDAFADAASRLSDAEVSPDHIERLLLGLQRGGVIGDQERFALHAVYLRQKASRTAANAASSSLAGNRGGRLRTDDAPGGFRARAASVRIEGGEGGRRRDAGTAGTVGKARNLGR